MSPHLHTPDRFRESLFLVSWSFHTHRTIDSLVYLSFYRRCTACRRKRSLRTGSFFNEFPRTSMGKILSTIYLWSMHELRATAARMLDMTKNAIGNVYALLRHYCGEDLRDRPIIPIDGRTLDHACYLGTWAFVIYTLIQSVQSPFVSRRSYKGWSDVHCR